MHTKQKVVPPLSDSDYYTGKDGPEVTRIHYHFGAPIASATFRAFNFVTMFKLLICLVVGMAVAFSPASRMVARSLKMTATAADVVSETTLATMARDARGLAIDSISAVSLVLLTGFWSSLLQF